MFGRIIAFLLLVGLLVPAGTGTTIRFTLPLVPST
jgi:hypothetical protein